MSIQETISTIRTGICKIEFYQDGNLVNSGTGFIYKEKLVTNSHVFHPEGFTFPNDTIMRLIFGSQEEINLTIGELRLVTGSDEQSKDFAVYEVSNLKDRFNFEVSDLANVHEGDEILILGFPFDASYLTTHHGRISAIFKEGDVDKIQIDASVNQGNSGGPLFHLESGKVIGIVTRKQTGLAKDFDDLIQSFSQNIEVLERSGQGARMTIGGIDPVEVLKVTQGQMQVISRNIKRSANTGIGYAFSCGALLEEDI